METQLFSKDDSILRPGRQEKTIILHCNKPLEGTEAELPGWAGEPQLGRFQFPDYTCPCSLTISLNVQVLQTLQTSTPESEQGRSPA